MTVNEHVFKVVDNGDNIEFIGDFEGLYKSEDDPWEQSVRFCSQQNQLTDILNIAYTEKFSYLEIGCGLGYRMDGVFNKTKARPVMGMDISEVALDKALKIFPDYTYWHGDIRKDVLNLDFDCICLMGTLWYVMYDLELVLDNVYTMLKPGGRFIISQVWIEEQKYGTDVFTGFGGFLEYLLDLCVGNDYYKVEKAVFESSGSEEGYYDTNVVLRKV